MAGCGRDLNCTNLYSPVTITVLPDIVGIGVLTSFIVTASATVGTLLFGYFMDFLPGDYLTWGDWGFLKHWHACQGCRKRNRAMHRGETTAAIPPCPHTNPNTDARRRKGFNTFILTLSDQQLVTGPAMIIAALAQRCQISCYEFIIVNSLAFLASTTHLSSLLVLRQYFRENKEVRNIRVVGMSVNLILLLYTTLVAASATSVDSSVRVQCVMDTPAPDMDIVNLVITFVFLILSYGRSFYQLFTEPNETDGVPRQLLKKYCCKDFSGPFEDEMFEHWYEKEVIQSVKRPDSNARREFFWNSATPIREDEKTNVRQRFFLVAAVLFDFKQSFLSELPTVLFSASYGITQVISSRTYAPNIEGSENTVDFGQIVPLFLLVLPILAAVEVYYDSHPEKPEKKRTIGTRFSTYFRAKTSKVMHEVQVAAQQSISASENGDEAEIGMSELQPDSNPSRINIGMTRIPRGHMDMLQGRNIEGKTRDMSSGFVILQNSIQAIAIDPKMISPYSRRDATAILNFIFFFFAVLSFSTGIVLFFASFYGLLWTVLTLMALLIQVIEYLYFATIVMTRARDFKRNHIGMRPTEGSRAPVPSINEEPGPNPPVEPALEPVHAPEFDPQEKIDAERIINALPPRRRQTFEAPDENDNEVPQRPTRTDTEANIGM